MTNQTTPAAKTVSDLMDVTGLGRDTVRAAIRTGSLPGYYVRTDEAHDRGKYVVPGEAFERFCKGEWQPTHRPVFTEAIRPLPQASDLIQRRVS